MLPPPQRGANRTHQKTPLQTRRWHRPRLHLSKVGAGGQWPDKWQLSPFLSKYINAICFQRNPNPSGNSSPARKGGDVPATNQTHSPRPTSATADCEVGQQSL